MEAHTSETEEPIVSVKGIGQKFLVATLKGLV
jgi:hypothetical protein